MPPISQLSQEQRGQAALNRSRARYEQNASQIRVRNSEHIANVRANNPDLREESRAREATARVTWRRSERIRNIERIRDAEGHAHRRQDPGERQREQVQDTAHHATRRTDPEYRSRERIRDMEAPRAYHRQDSEEHAREQERNTEEHRQRRRNPEERQREREMDANNRRATRRNPIARSQEQRMNTSQRRETRQQRRIREEQIRQMAEDRLINFRMDPQNRLDASQRQSQRNMDATAALSEDEMEQERELQPNSEKDISELFAKYFASNLEPKVSWDEREVLQQILPLLEVGCLDILDCDIVEASSHFNESHTPDLDGISPFFIKKCIASLTTPLQLLFSLSLSSGGSRADVTNYRPIAKICNIAKLLERIVTKKLTFLIRNFISHNQHGFLPGRSTTTNLVVFSKHCLEAFERRCQVDAIYTDFSKAFDKIEITLLIFSRIGVSTLVISSNISTS
ncbi:uncharacterized protein Dana_GF27165 [Drosophila ananassae]|uniref:Uncharacterized protein n=1 Tax=Drosophila ananassae TaxID=7217 RepID=A0A0P9BVL2_DROAN|nr:uncharacterized protein Dana_GF27165 [Drosophila ananassae]